MSDESSSAMKGLRERLAAGTEDKLGRALADLLDNPLLTGTIGRAFDSRERVAQAQELAMGVLNLPSAADIERLTRRLRSVSQRLEGIEDGVHRMDRATVTRLSSIEDQLGRLATRLEADSGRIDDRSPSASERASAPQRASAKPEQAPKRASARSSSRPSKAPKPRAGRVAGASKSSTPASKAKRPKA